MKITTEVSYAGISPAGNVSSRKQVTQPLAGSEVQESQLINDFNSKTQRDRAMIDALIIAQTSKALVQKAMDISSRLRSIAFQAMTTGQVNMQELGVEVAGIQGTMQSYGESVSVPVSSYSTGQALIPESFSSGLKDMLSSATEMSFNNSVDPDVFSTMNQDFSKIASEADARITGIESQLGFKTEDIRSGKNPVQPADMPVRITQNPGLSLLAQGNVSPEIVRALTAV